MMMMMMMNKQWADVGMICRLLQCRDTVAAAAEYSEMMRCHDDTRQSSIRAVAAKSADEGCTFVDGNSVSGAAYQRRFSSPARTLLHVSGHHNTTDTVPGLWLIEY